MELLWICVKSFKSMKLSKILSQRAYATTPSWNIVYEWEDIISQSLKIQVDIESSFKRKFIIVGLDRLRISQLLQRFIPKRDLFLWYTSIDKPNPSIRLNKNCIPVIIDFWLKKDDLPKFYNSYKNVPLILVTNYEVLELLKSNHCPIPVEHWALSFPDYYALTDTLLKKEYDVCLFGRNSPFFIKMLDLYSAKHPNFIYIKNEGISSNRNYFTNKGELVCHDTGRDCYINMIKKTRVSCYSTPGVDESKQNANGFNQVTPRVFEMLCNQCHVIGHYPISSDVKWYSLDKVVPNVNNYKEFEQCLNHMLSTPFDVPTTKKIVMQHYTSNRALQLIEILSKYNITL